MTPAQAASGAASPSQPAAPAAGPGASDSGGAVAAPDALTKRLTEHLPERLPERLHYGGDADFAPFESLDAAGRPQGFQVELLAALATQIGRPIDITLQPWAQTEAAFRAGQRDLVAMVDTGTRRGWARFTRGHATTALAFYHRSDQGDPQGLQDLAERRLVVPDREAMRDTLARGLPLLAERAVRVADPAAALAAVAEGRADVALLPRAYADALLARGQAHGVVASSLSLPLQTYALAVAPQADALHALLQQGLDALERTGQLEALRLRWLGSHRTLAQRNALAQGLARQQGLAWGLGGVGLLALGAMAWGLRRRGQRIATERQQRQAAQAALQQAEALLERAFVQHPDPMLIADADGRVVRDANPALLGLLGAPASALLGQPLSALGPVLGVAAVVQLDDVLAQAQIAGGLDAPVPWRVQRADGQPRDCLLSAEPLRLAGAPQLLLQVRDVTDALRQDRLLREAYARLDAELARARQALDTARAGQQQAEQQLQHFTRAVSHDLRTPLSAVQGFAGLLRDRLRQGRTDDAAAFADQIHQAAQRMNSMIGALQRLAQVSRQPLQRQAIDMALQVQQTWALLQAAQPGATVASRVAPLPPGQGDPELVALVWQNLLGNAFKYSARVARPAVAVDSFSDARGTWWRVADNGVGFDSAAAAERLFQPFQRLHDGGFEGSGLGLSLVRRIIDHHGGEVQLRSTPGVGTVVAFTLDPAPG